MWRTLVFLLEWGITAHFTFHVRAQTIPPHSLGSVCARVNRINSREKGITGYWL